METQVIDINLILKKIQKKQKQRNTVRTWFLGKKYIIKKMYFNYLTQYMIEHNLVRYKDNIHYDDFVSEYAENVRREFFKNKGKQKDDDLDDLLFKISNDVILNYNDGSTFNYNNHILKSNDPFVEKKTITFFVKVKASLHVIKSLIINSVKDYNRKREVKKTRNLCRKMFPNIREEIILGLINSVYLNQRLINKI